MPRAYSVDLRERVIAVVEAGASARSAGRRFGVSASTAVRWVERWRRTGSVSALRMGGYRRSVLEAHAATLLALVAERPDATVAELRGELGARGIDVGASSISRFFARHGISYKKNRVRRRTEQPGGGRPAGDLEGRPGVA